MTPRHAHPAISRRAAGLLGLAASLVCAALPAVEEMAVVGLFRDRAVVVVDGQRRLLKVGVPSPEGVLLIEADSRRALIEVDGRRGEYPLGEHIRTGFPTRSNLVVRIRQDRRGGFYTGGKINGTGVTFHVDTGATSVAMNSGTAESIGIDYRAGTPEKVTTSSGVTTAWFVDLDSVDIGGIEVRGVRAGVLEGAYPALPLLGMSYLDKVDMVKREDVLELRRR